MAASEEGLEPLSGGPAAHAANGIQAVTGGDDLQAGEVLQYCDFRDFLRHLGVDPLVDASGTVMVAAHHMFADPLPPHWTEQVDEGSSRVYFFNKITDESVWVHPQEALFRELVEEVRSWRPDEPLESIFARSDADLRKAHKAAVETIAQWSCHDAPQGPEEAPEFGDSQQFYFNTATGESRWADPRQSVEFDLRQRHSILCACMVAHTQTLAKMMPQASNRSSDSSEGEADQPSVQAFVQNLWDSLGTLPLPARQSSDVGDLAPPSSERRPSHLLPPAGDDTVRSSMSYLTARSTAESCTESARGS